MFVTDALPQRRFQLILVKPSRYDDDGYVVQWLRSSIPSNSLAAVYGLALDAAERQVLGPDVAIDISVTDEINTRVKVNDLIALIRRHGGFGMVGFVGVQSNQFPPRSTWRGRYVPRAFRLWSAGFMFPAALPCCRSFRPISKRHSTSA
jgi:hypothetical protein